MKTEEKPAPMKHILQMHSGCAMQLLIRPVQL